MLNNYKMIKRLEDKISELEEKIPDEYDIREIVNNAIEEEKVKLSDIYEVRRDTREKAWDDITSGIEDIVEQRLPDLIREASKDIQDKLIVKLARKAMGMEEND